MDKTFHVCYLREYHDPEHIGETFEAYETVYRNVPEKFRKIFTDKVKMKIVKFLDWNYKETATNFTKISRVEIIENKDYWMTYEDVFGDTAKDDKALFNDYGQQWSRSSLRKDFNFAITKSKVKHYDNKKV